MQPRRPEALPGLLTLRGGQFMFDCFQNRKAPGLEERILADLTLRCRVWSFKGLCNSLVWNGALDRAEENRGTC